MTQFYVSSDDDLPAAVNTPLSTNCVDESVPSFAVSRPSLDWYGWLRRGAFLQFSKNCRQFFNSIFELQRYFSVDGCETTRMPQNIRLPAVLAIATVTAAFVVASATYAIPELTLGAAPVSVVVAILVATVAFAALCLSVWEVWAEKFVARNRTRETRTAWFLDRETFVDFIDIALAAPNQTSRSILLIEVDGLPSTVGVTNTIGSVVHRAADSVVATMSTKQFAVLLRGLTSDQVLTIAEEILAAFPATESVPPLKVSIGVCFCLPSTTAESALGVSENALRLAKRQDGNAWRSIAEGGVRSVSRRPIRAPTLSRGSSGAEWASP